MGTTPMGVVGAKESVSNWPLAISGAKWDLMKASAAAWPGELAKRLGAAARNCWVSSKTWVPVTPAEDFAACFCDVAGIADRRRVVAKRARKVMGSTPSCG